MLRKIFKWISRENNSRGISSISSIFNTIAVCGPAMAILMASIAPLLSQSYSNATYGEVYRQVQRDMQHETEKTQLRLEIELLKIRYADYDLSPEDRWKKTTEEMLKRSAGFYSHIEN